MVPSGSSPHSHRLRRPRALGYGGIHLPPAQPGSGPSAASGGGGCRACARVSVSAGASVRGARPGLSACRVSVAWPACVCVSASERVRADTATPASPSPRLCLGGARRPGGGRGAACVRGRGRRSVRPPWPAPAPGSLRRPFRSETPPAPSPGWILPRTHAHAQTHGRGAGAAPGSNAAAAAPGEAAAAARTAEPPAPPLPRPPAPLTPRAPGPAAAFASAFNSWRQTCRRAGRPRCAAPPSARPGTPAAPDSTSAGGPPPHLLPAACDLCITAGNPRSVAAAYPFYGRIN